MSNNIYDILKKFNSLDSVKNMLSEGKKVCSDCGKAKCECVNERKGSKPDYIDLDKDGDTNEPMKKAAKDKSKGAIAEAVARVEQNLAEKYQGFKKSVAEGVKPKGTISPTDSGEEYTAAPGYRVKAEFEPGSTGKPKMGFVKSEPEQTGQGAKPADQTKPVNKKEVDEDNSGTVPPKHYGGEGPTGAAFDLYMQQRKEQLAKQRPKNEDMLSPKQKKIARMSPPPNKIDANDLAALRAGKKKKAEGNAFSGAMAKAKATGQDEFEVGGKEYEVQEGIEDTLQNILPKSMQPFNTETAAKNAAAARASRAQAPVKEGTTQIKSLQRALYASMNAEANGQGEGGNDPEYMKYAAQIRDMIKKDFGRGADFLLGQASQGDGYADQYLMGARERGVDILTIEKLLDYDDGDESEYTDVDDMGIYRRPAPVQEGFPTVDDAKKRMDAKAGKTAHGTKTVTKTGVKHERNYDADEPTGERGRPKKDKFAK